MIKENKIKKMLAEGKTAIGTYIKSTDPAITEVICMSGFDFVIFDNEHTSMNKETMVNLIRTSEIYDVPAFVRVRECDQPQILQALDAGAVGVQVPNVNNAEDVVKSVKSTKYAPNGYRGFAVSQRSAGYGCSMNAADYIKLNNENIMTICYCETKAGYDNLDEILKVDGLDMIFMGPADLSQAFGVIGSPSHPIVTDAMDIIIEKTLKAGKYVGTIAADGDAVNHWIQKGVNFLVMSSDFGLMNSCAKQYLAQIKR